MNSGLSTQLFEEKHRRAMGEAVWLYGKLVGSQTRQNGLVHGGRVFTYKTLHEMTGYGVRTIEKWLKRLEAKGYVAVEHTNFKMMRIRILKQKKFRTKQTGFDFSYPASQREGKASISRQPAGRVPASQRDTAPQRAGSNKNLSMSSNETPERTLSVPPQSILQGLGVSLSLWVQFKKMRERIHRPLIEGADELIIRDLLQFQDKGESPGEVIEQAVKTSSYTLYAVRKVNGNGNGHESYQEKRDRDGSQAITDILGVSSGLARSVQSSLRQGHAPPIRGRLPPGT